MFGRDDARRAKRRAGYVANLRTTIPNGPTLWQYRVEADIDA
jgi:hypothetical protein